MYLIPIGYLKQFELESSFPITILQLFIFLCILNGTHSNDCIYNKRIFLSFYECLYLYLVEIHHLLIN